MHYCTKKDQTSCAPCNSIRTTPPGITEEDGRRGSTPCTGSRKKYKAHTAEPAGCARPRSPQGASA